MSDTKHSPLPWTATANSWQYTTIYDALHRPVCQFDLEDWGVTEENQDELETAQAEAAAFIVLATSLHHELVAALEEAIRHLEDAQSGFIPMCGSDEAWTKKQGEIVADARAVLAKAKQPNLEEPR